MIWVLIVILVCSLFVNVRLLRSLMSLDKFDGQMVIEETDETLIYHLELNNDPEYTLEGKESVTFQVLRQTG